MKSIVQDIVRAAGHGWSNLEYSMLALGGYAEEELVAITGAGRAPVAVPDSVTEAAEELRSVMAAPEVGSWFTAVIKVDDSLAYDAHFDYDHEPAWETQPGSSEYVRDAEHFPRAAEHRPDWYEDGLSRARA